MAATRREYPEIAPTGPSYSRGVRAGNLLFISGCTARGTDAQGKSLLEQLRITLDRITRIADAEGGASADIVKITTYVTSDGGVRKFRPGDVFLVEDNWGKGHSSRIIGNESVLFFAVVLAESDFT